MSTSCPCPLLKLATLGAAIPQGFGEDVEPGDYRVVGTSVILRKGPSAASENIGTLENGENVHAFGDSMIDDNHMVGPNGLAVPNDGSSPGIEYVHVGTQTHGAGWVAINFLTPGKGTTVDTPAPQPTTTTPTSSTPTSAKKDKVTTFLVGGLIGVAVLGGIVLLVKNYKSPRRLAHA